MSGVRRRLRHRVVLTAFVVCASATSALGQEVRIDVVVEQLAGSDIYLAAGSEAGLATGDTLVVFAEPDGVHLGTLYVIAVSSQRSVVTFLGEPFPVTRGTTLRVAIGRSAAGVSAATRSPVSNQGAGSAGVRQAARVRGRLGIDVSGLQSTTSWLGNTAESVRRRFATPSVSLRLTASRLPGGFGVEMLARGTYRYSDADIVQPTTVAHIRQLAVTNSFGDAPLEMRVGRFYSPYETYSGYWDGLAVRLGNRTIGVGGAVGFQPERADQAPSSALPKYSAFVDYALRTGAVRYETDVSFHRVLPNGGYLDHTFAGWSQRLRVGSLRIATDVRADDDPISSTWALSRARASGTLLLTRGLSLNARASRDRPYFLFRRSSLLPFRRDQMGGGLMYYGAAGSVGANVSLSRTGDGSWFAAYSGSAGVPLTGLGLGLSAAATFTDLRDGNAWFVAADLVRRMGRVDLRGSYQFYRSAISQSILASHTTGIALTFPLSRRAFAAIRARTQFGAHLAATSVYASLWTTF